MARALLPVLGWFLASTASAADPCELPTDLALQAEQAVIEGRFGDMPGLVDRFEGSLSCAPSVDPGTLAAFLRAEGAWFHLTQLPDEAAFAFRSAAKLAPAVWTEAFGASAHAAFVAAAQPEPPGSGTLQLEPAPADPHLLVHIDGEETTLPLHLDAGIHAIQLIRGPESNGPVGHSRFGKLVAVFPGEDIRVNPGVLPVEETSALLAPKSRGPVWLLASAGGALLISGITATAALQQPRIAEEASSIAEVNQAEKRQRALAFTSYGLMGAGLVATGVYFAW